jgi:dolichyl-phosphate-mannose--protein O-mannosyl transferase
MTVAHFAASGCDAPDSRTAEPEMKKENCQPALWTRVDTLIITSLAVVGAAVRFWRLDAPAQLFFDERLVHSQADRYLHGWSSQQHGVFLSSHPPLAKLIVALSIRLFGDSPWSWRGPNALIGTALIAVTYLLARRAFHSRLAAALAGALVFCDGIFLVASRTAMINIVYVTIAACAYLVLFRFLQETDRSARRRELIVMGPLLGLFLGTKFGISEVGAAMIVGFMLWDITARSRDRTVTQRWLEGLGVLGVLISLSGITFVAVFFPYYWFGWWHGVGDLIAYHRWVLHRHMIAGFFKAPAASPFWSWPLLAHPFGYWRKPVDSSQVVSVWCGGNPLLWWAVLVAVPLAARRRSRAQHSAWTFVTMGYLCYMAMWIPVERELFIYDYMPAVYIGELALAGLLAECWQGHAGRWEAVALLVPLAPVLLLGIGNSFGLILFLAVVASYLVLMLRTQVAGKFVCIALVGMGFAVFVYFFPIWTAIPVSPDSLDARFWFHGPGLVDWTVYFHTG